jgi:hypothetical protein
MQCIVMCKSMKPERFVERLDAGPTLHVQDLCLGLVLT